MLDLLLRQLLRHRDTAPAEGKSERLPGRPRRTRPPRTRPPPDAAIACKYNRFSDLGQSRPSGRNWGQDASGAERLAGDAPAVVCEQKPAAPPAYQPARLRVAEDPVREGCGPAEVVAQVGLP